MTSPWQCIGPVQDPPTPAGGALFGGWICRRIRLYCSRDDRKVSLWSGLCLGCGLSGDVSRIHQISLQNNYDLFPKQ